MPKNAPASPAEKFHDRDMAQASFQSVSLRDAQFHMADLGNARFQIADLSGARFEDINLSGATFHDINFSNVTLSAAQLGGATFKDIGLPPGSVERQRGVTFTQADLKRFHVPGVRPVPRSGDGLQAGWHDH